MVLSNVNVVEVHVGCVLEILIDDCHARFLLDEAQEMFGASFTHLPVSRAHDHVAFDDAGLGFMALASGAVDHVTRSWEAVDTPVVIEDVTHCQVTIQVLGAGVGLVDM